VVNFNYVSSPKFVQSRNVLLMSPLAYQSFRSFWSFPTTAYGIFLCATCNTDCLQILYKIGKNSISVPNTVHQLTLSLRCKYCKIHSRSKFQDAINSIRRLAASDCKPMTSVFYDIIRLESADARTCLQKAIFDGFWGIWTTKCCRPSCGPPKGHFLTSQRVFWTNLEWNSMTGLLQ